MIGRARLVGTVLVAALTTGCGSVAGGAGSADAREWRVAEDPGATVDQILDAGVPVDVAVSGDGDRRVVTWRVRPEDDEGSSWGAWRLYDAAGARVADGRFAQVQEQGAVIDVHTVPDGFLLLDYASGRWHHLDTAGSLQEARRGGRAVVSAGDVLLDPWAEQVWSVSGHEVRRLPRPPTGAPQGTAVDPDGTVSVLLPDRPGGDAVVASSPGGTGPWARTRVDLPPGGVPGALTTASDGSLLLTSLVPDDDFGHVDAVLRRDGDGPWRSTPVPASLGMTEPQVDVLDGRLLLGDGERLALGDADGSGFTLLEPPGRERSALVAGDRLWNTDGADHALRVSDDDGATWEDVTR